MQKKRILLVLLILVVVAAGWWFWHDQDQDTVQDHLTLYGNVDIREAQLSFNASEHVAEVHVQEGDRVTRGQVLAQLHTSLLQAQVAEADAWLAAQREVVAELEAGSRPEEIEKGRAELKAAQAKAKAAHDTARRLSQLLLKKLASADEVEVARASAELTEAQVEAADRALALLVAGPRKEKIAAARAGFKAREAGLALATEHLADATLIAPADGVIRNRILEPGDMASPQTPALTLAFTDPVWVRAYLPEPALGKVAPGAKAEIRSDSYPDKGYAGWVGYISPTAEFTPKNVETPELRTRLVYSMRIYACNPQGELRLGMPATVTIALGQPPAQAGQDHCGHTP